MPAVSKRTAGIKPAAHPSKTGPIHLFDERPQRTVPLPQAGEVLAHGAGFVEPAREVAGLFEMIAGGPVGVAVSLPDLGLGRFPAAAEPFERIVLRLAVQFLQQRSDRPPLVFVAPGSAVGQP